MPELLNDAVGHVLRPKRTNRLNCDASGRARTQQSPWAGMLEMDDLIADFDFSRAAINKVYKGIQSGRVLVGKDQEGLPHARASVGADTRLVRDRLRHAIGIG
jgi:hypothetical protein